MQMLSTLKLEGLRFGTLELVAGRAETDIEWCLRVRPDFQPFWVMKVSIKGYQLFGRSFDNWLLIKIYHTAATNLSRQNGWGALAWQSCFRRSIISSCARELA